MKEKIIKFAAGIDPIIINGKEPKLTILEECGLDNNTRCYLEKYLNQSRYIDIYSKELLNELIKYSNNPLNFNKNNVMKKEDFNGILEKAFDPSFNRDATPNGKDFVHFFSYGDSKKEVFMGGTCNGSTWREEFLKHIDVDKVPCFNPVVEDWNEKAMIAEEEAKLRCGIHLYVITPKMKGIYSVAEAVNSAIINPKGTYIAFLLNDDKESFSEDQIKSIGATISLIEKFTKNIYLLQNVTRLKVVANDIMSSKRGYPDTVIMQLQNHPKKYAGVIGVQVYDIICLAKGIIQFFNDKVKHIGNIETVKMLNKALRRQEERTDERKARKVEGYDKE